MALNSGYSEFIGTSRASMLNKDLGILLKEGKSEQISLEFDIDHPEKYSITKILWYMCIQGPDWAQPIKKKWLEN